MTDRKSQKIIVQGIEVVTFRQNESDYISLTDMAKFKSYDSGVVIANWLSTKYTIQFMGAWEQVHNPNFNLMEFNKIRNESGSNGFIVSSSFWVKQTKAIGIKSSAGRYGGTYAHKDIAFEFATWLSPEFKLYLIKEFQRLKEVESQKLALGWDVKRTLTKINYKIHTDAIKKHLIPKNISKSRVNMVYASEADVLNVALFGKTAKEWRDENSNKEGNIRDYSDVTQLVVLANLEGMNAELIRQELSQPKRLIQLNEIAIVQMKSLLGNATLIKLK
ncbi:MAG: KilA-N domain-containing protein [Candidatus Roizmanbacteria bacterium]|nr:KilA-N domain-containing protein [Candidatus Roizmanbacteria bacterium]